VGDGLVGSVSFFLKHILLFDYSKYDLKYLDIS